MKKRRLIILALTIGPIVLASILGVFLYSEQLAERKLQDYIKRLENDGFATEERSLKSLNVDDVVRMNFFGDFRSFAKQERVERVYYDRGIHALYFLNPSVDRVEANVFYYK